MADIPSLAVLDLEMPQCRGLPEEVVGKHSEHGEEHSGVQEPRTGLSFTECFNDGVDLPSGATRVIATYLFRENKLNLREIERLLKVGNE